MTPLLWQAIVLSCILLDLISLHVQMGFNAPYGIELCGLVPRRAISLLSCHLMSRRAGPWYVTSRDKVGQTRVLPKLVS